MSGLNLCALKRKEVVSLLRQNGLTLARRRGNHEIWQGEIDKTKRTVTLDTKIDDFVPNPLGPLYFIAMSQLGFFRENLGSEVAWERFYGGDSQIASRADVPQRRWNDPYWWELYGEAVDAASKQAPSSLSDLNVLVDANPPAEAALSKLPKDLLAGIARVLQEIIEESMRITEITVREESDPELEDWKQLVLTIETPLSLEAAFAYWEQVSEKLSLLRHKLDPRNQELLDTYITLEVKTKSAVGV